MWQQCVLRDSDPECLLRGSMPQRKGHFTWGVKDEDESARRRGPIKGTAHAAEQHLEVRGQGSRRGRGHSQPLGSTLVSRYPPQDLHYLLGHRMFPRTMGWPSPVLQTVQRRRDPWSLRSSTWVSTCVWEDLMEPVWCGCRRVDDGGKTDSTRPLALGKSWPSG